MMTERDLIRRHQSALRAIDLYDDRAAINAVLAKTGPRTGTHPMATRIEPTTPRPMATRIRPPLLDIEDDFDDLLYHVILVLLFSAAAIAMTAIALEWLA